MARLRTFTIDKFTGLDFRRISTRSDHKSQRVDRNASITSGQGIRSRPGTKVIAKAHPDSKGLFAANGRLYAVAPAGYPSITQTETPLFGYLELGDGVGWDADNITELLDADTYGEDGIGGNIPYVVILTKNGTVEHHYLDVKPDPVSNKVNTLVEIPFVPSESIIKLDGRLWASSNASGAVYFNSIQGGARDWTTSEDAGFIQVTQHAPGLRKITGLTYYRDRLCILFEDSMQIWATDFNPDLIQIIEVLNGPGTSHRRAADNVLGDTFYFSRGGFRRISSALVEGEREESDIGARVRSLTDTLIKTTETPISLWSQNRGQFVTAFDDTVLAYTYIPSDKVFGWTEWDTPFTVTDLIENDGILYCRDTDDNIRVFDDNLTEDDGDAFTWDIRTQFLAKTADAPMWEFVDVSIGMDGTADVSCYPIQEDDTQSVSLGTWTGTTMPLDKIHINQMAPSLAIGLHGTGYFQLDSLTLSVEKLMV